MRVLMVWGMFKSEKEIALTFPIAFRLRVLPLVAISL